MRKFIEIESKAAFGFVSVRCYPWGAHHFFNEPIRNFLDGTIDIKHLWPKDAKRILNEVKNAENSDKAKVVQNFLLGRLQKHKKPSEAIDEAIRLIRKSKGSYSIDAICEKLNMGYKQLERHFLKTIGTTPKVFSRTTRFLNLCHHLKEYEGLTMTQLALKMGYYDQSHFNKDFKAFSGLTPKEYYKLNNVFFADF